jgi:hypothetical protein
MKFDPEQLLTDITDLMTEADAEAAKGGRLHKAGVHAHASTKATHHEKMAELHAKIADHHAAMSDHYKSGAKGAYKDDAKKDSARKAAEPDEGDEDEGTVDTRELETKKVYGALDSIRSRPSRRQEVLTRAEFETTLGEFAQNLTESIVKVLAPPREATPSEDELAAARLLRSKGFEVKLPAATQERRPALTDVSGAADARKVATADDKKQAADDDARAGILKAKITALRSALGDPQRASPSAKAELAAAEEELNQMAEKAIRKAIDAPKQAVSGDTAGLRGFPMADIGNQ